jgi:hypothetical protein
MREPGRAELTDPGDVALDVRAAGYLRTYVLLAHRLGCRVERGRPGQLGVHSPAGSHIIV